MSGQLIEIFTDGACRGNPGPGGWGAMLRCDGQVRDLSGSELHTTNNRMELMAAIRALESLTRPCQVQLTTDSEYVKRGITEWLPNWKKRGWKTSNKKPVKNKDLWCELDEAITRHKIDWFWVRGHTGVAGNEAADELANRGIDEL